MTTPLHRIARPDRSAICLALALGAGLLGACGEMRMTMDGTMRLEGPVQIQMSPMQFQMSPIAVQTSIVGPSVQYDGAYISDALIEKIEKDKTRTDWILAVFGEPTERHTLEDGSEIWKWAYRPSSQQISVVSLFGGGDDEKPASAPRMVFVHIRGVIAVDVWHD